LEAYLLIQTQSKGQTPVAAELRSIPGIVSAHDLRGPYDAIARARAGSREDLVQRVVTEVRRVPGVTRALSAPLVRPILDASAPDEAA
jgi:DNA-binding Lrp family transcriptional regulator